MDIKAEMEGIQPYPDTKFIKFFGRLYAAVFVLFAITALSVFVLPENILDASAACADFVKFMKRFFPNIAAIGKISPHTQLAEFYVAVLWISLAGFFVISWIFIPTSLFLYEKKELEDVKTQLLYFFGILIGYLGVTLPPILP